MAVINNVNELEAALQPTLEGLVDMLAGEVYTSLEFFLHHYYTGWTPSVYQRTKAFLNSAVKTEARLSGGKVMAEVYIDYNSMNNYVSATGFQVATWANEGLHGGISVGHEPYVWDNTIADTVDNGTLLKQAVLYLKSKGFSVRE